MQPDPNQHRLFWYFRNGRNCARTNRNDQTSRAFEEEAGLVNTSFLYGKKGALRERPLDGLPPASEILYDTGIAMAAALGFGVLVGAVMQWTGLR
jgi:hypothetical protein